MRGETTDVSGSELAVAVTIRNNRARKTCALARLRPTLGGFGNRYSKHGVEILKDLLWHPVAACLVGRHFLFPIRVYKQWSLTGY